MARIKVNRRVRLVQSRKQTLKKFSPKDLVYTMMIVMALGLVVERGYDGLYKEKSIEMVNAEPHTNKVQAYEAYTAPDPSTLSVVDTISDDVRVNKLKSYLKENDSPLSDYAQVIVDQADKYDIGWTKLVAISAIESNYGTKIKPGSHNAWGIMINGEVHSFESWTEGIEYTSKLLSSKYKELEMEAIKGRYCPSEDCHEGWVEIVMASSEEILK